MQNSNLKLLTPLFFILWYWFYLNIYIGFLLSKIFYNFFGNIEFQKKFSFKNIIKIIINFFLKLIKNWFIRIVKKSLLLNDAIAGSIRAVKIFLKKFKRLLKFKYNFRLLKKLLPIFLETFFIFCSLISEIMFLSNIIDWVIQWVNIIWLLMTESLFITKVIYGLYLIILGIFAILLGFLLGISRHKAEVNQVRIFLLLLLLKIFYNNGFDDVLLEPLRIRSLKPSDVEKFSKFSLKSIEEINPRPLKIIFKEPEQIPLPFFIKEDPTIVIETEIVWEKSINYKFQLFQFYEDINQKIKS